MIPSPVGVCVYCLQGNSDQVLDTKNHGVLEPGFISLSITVHKVTLAPISRVTVRRMLYI